MLSGSVVPGSYISWDQGPRLVATMPRTAREILVDHNEIEFLAYLHWIERGCPWGSPEQDWFRAESELKAQTATARKPPAQAEPRANKRAIASGA